MLSSRKASDLEEATADLKGRGIDARWIAADCANEADIRRLADETLERLGHVDILVNNAGATWGAPAEDHPVDAWDKVMNLNVRGYFILSQHMAKHSMIAPQAGQHHQRGVHRRPGRQPARHEHHCLQHLQGRGHQLHARAGGRMGQVQHPRQRHLPGLLPSKMTVGTLKALGEENWPPTPRWAAWATTKT
jgi:NAD(P)-dependent dehydrogenase (short-subunit alcohol dehydrogenase family)